MKTRTSLTPFSRRNLDVIENFLLHYFAPDGNKDNTEYERMLEAARDYIEEDHVDGEGSEAAIAQLERARPRLEALEVVRNNPELAEEFARAYNDRWDEIEGLIKNDFIKPSAAQLLIRLAKRVNP